MKKKIIVCAGVALIAIASVSIGVKLRKNNVDILKDDINIVAQDNSYNTYTYITEDMINNSEKSTMYAELKSEYTPDSMLEVSDAVALVTIVSEDGASMEYSAFGMTYGTMVVNDVLYGNINSNGLVEFLKPGGYITMSDYDAHDIPASVEKRDYLREQAGIEIDKENTYIKLQVEDDVELEVGKTYLAYLHYREKYGKYEIVGLRNGLREVNVAQQTRVKTQSLDLNNLQIKNNVTGEWESLNEYVKVNIEK